MKSKKSYKILRGNWKQFEKVADMMMTLKENETLRAIRVNESFTLEVLRQLYKKEYVEDLELEELVLLEMPISKARLEKFNSGVYINNVKYRWFESSPSWQRKSDKNYQGCVLFVKDKAEKTDKHNIVEKHNNIISLMKTKEWQKSKEDKFDISKINARISLGLTGANHCPMDYSYTVIPNLTKTITDKILFNDNSKAKREIKSVDIELFDGMGLISFEYADKLAKYLKLKETPSFFVVRGYGMAIKGVLVRFDIKKYFKEFNINEITNLWGNVQATEGLDVIFTESMTKWAKNFGSKTQFETRKDRMLDNLKEAGYEGIAHLFKGLWISKVEKQLPIMTRSNYQLLSNLNLTKKEYFELCKYTFNLYKEICDGDFDKTLLWLKDIIRETDLEEEIELYTATSKVHQILQVNPKMINDVYIQAQIKKMLKKKITNALACKIYIKGAFRTLTADPIAFMEHCCGQEVKGCLSKNNFYEAEEVVGNIKTYSRNPLNHYAEIYNRTIEKNEVTEKWMSHLTGLTVVNIHDLSLPQASGADLDGDLTFSVDDEIIKHAVVSECPVIYLGDGKFEAEKYLYRENRLRQATKAGLGSAIGAIANNSTSYSVLAQIEGLEGFYNKADILTQLRDLGMAAIDAQKTGESVEVPKSIKIKERPYFFYYRDKKENKITWTENEKENGVISSVCIKLREAVKKHIWKINIDEKNDSTKDLEFKNIEKISKSEITNLLIDKTIELNFALDDLKTLDVIVEDYYQSYRKESSKIKKENKKGSEERSNLLDLLHFNTQKKFKDLEQQFDKRLIANTVVRNIYNNNRSSNFVFRFVYENVLENLMKNSTEITRYSYRKTETGIELLGNYYNKIKVKSVEKNEINNVELAEKQQKFNSLIKRKNIEDFESRMKFLLDKEEILNSLKNELEIVSYKVGCYDNVAFKHNEKILGYLLYDSTYRDGIDLNNFKDLGVKARIKTIKNENEILASKATIQSIKINI